MKFFKFLKSAICINGESDREMVNVPQLSPRVTRSKAKQLEAERQKPTENEEQQKKIRTVGRPKKKRKGKTNPGELDSVRASKGSVGSMSFLQLPERGVGALRRGSSTPKKELAPPPNPVSGKSPPVGTLSADTPERSLNFHKKVENVARCSHRILAKGSFGTIVQATYKGELVAAKIVPPHRASSLKNELNNFLLSHNNIVKTLRIIFNEDENSCGLVIMEMCSSFTMEHLANDDCYTLNDKLIAGYMVDIGCALDYCHEQRVLHLDVKPLNILVNLATKVCKLCDFGSSCLLMGEDMIADKTGFETFQSTVVYTSPELLAGGCPTVKSDVYSFGIVLWQLVHREKPYVVDNKIDLQSTIYKIVKQKKRPERKSKKEGPIDKLYIQCWDHDPEKRPTMKEIVEYLKNIQKF